MLPFEDALPFETLPFEEEQSSGYALDDAFKKNFPGIEKGFQTAKDYAEAGISTGIGMAAQVPAAIMAFQDTANKVLSGRYKESDPGGVFGKVQQALTPEPMTDEGKALVEQLGRSGFMQSLNAFGAVAHTMPPMRTAPSPKSFVPKELPKQNNKIEPTLKEGLPREPVQMELPFETTLQQAAEIKGAAVGQPDLFGPINVPRAAEVPPTVPGFEALTREQRDSRSLQNFRENAKQDSIVEDFGNNDPMARMPEMRVDENGIPIRADLTMEARNLENPLQRNLWGDELGPALDQQRSLTEAIDSMPTGPARTAAIQQLQNGVPKGQRGAINMEMFDPAFEKIKELANGITLKIRGSETGPYVTAYKDGKTIGEVAAEAVDYANPHPRSNMESAGTWVAKDHQRQGVATEMYKFLAENGNDIVPSKAQMPGGKALWEGLEKKGISEYKRIPRGQQGGIDLDILVPKKFSDFVERWMNSGGNINHVSVIRMLADIPTKLSKIQRELLEEQFPETAKKYQEKIDRAVSNSDMEAAQRWGTRYDNALIADAVTKHFDAYNKGFKLDGETYAGTNGFGANRVKARIEAERVLSIVKKQRGGIDLHEIAEGITKLFKPTRTAVDHMANQPGMGASGKDLIFTPKSGYEVLDQIKGESDGPALFTNMQSGLMHASEKGNSTLVKTAGQWLQYGQRMGDYGVRNIVQPLEKTLSRFSTKEMLPLMDALKEEMFQRKQMTPEELAARGLSARQINAYRELRQVQAEALKRQNEGRAALGKEPITEQNAYLSSIFTGDYHIPVKDVNGKLLWYIQQPTKGLANKAIKWLKEKVPEADHTALKVEYRPGLRFGDVPSDMMGAYQEMIKLLDPKDPATAAIKEAMEQWASERGATVLGQQKHHSATKANVRGFEGDQPWLSPKENAYNLAKAQIKYLQNAFRWASMQEAMSQIKPMLSDPEIIAKQPNNVEITKAYMLNNMGVSKNMFKEFEAYTAEKFGRSSALVPGVVRDLKGITYAMQLGLSPGYWIATPLQLVAANLAWHTDLGALSGKPLKDISLSIIDGVAGIANEWSADVSAGHFKDRLPMSKFGKEAAQWAEANGIINTNLFDDNRGLGGHKVFAAGEHVVGWTISKPEQFSRWVTFVGFARHLDSTGEFIGRRSEMFQRAAELTDNVATDMHRQARPLIVDKFGAAGEGAYIYKAPVFNMLNTLSIFARKAADGDAKPLLTYLAAMGVMGGVANLPFASELDGSLEAIKGFVSKNKPEWYKHLQGVSIKEAMLRNVPDTTVAGTIANWGLASQVTGINMSSRFNQSVVDIENPFSGVAPLAQEGLEWLSAGNVALNPNRDTAAAAMYINSPPLGKGLLESFHPSFKSGTKAPDGSWTGYRNPNHVENPDTYVKRSPEEEQARLAGLIALSEGKRRTKDYINNQESKRTDTAQKQLLEKFWSASQRDDAQAAAMFIKKYAELGGDLDKLQPFIAQNVERLGMTQSEYNKVHAKTITQFNNIMRRNELGK